MEIGDFARIIGKQRVVRAVGAEFGHFQEFGQIGRARAQKALLQRLDRLVHQRKGDPLATLFAHDRAVVAGPGHESALRQRAVGLAIAQPDRLALKRAHFAAIAVGLGAIGPVDHGFGKFVDIVDARRGVHPPGVRVEPLVDEELAPGHRAIGVQPLVAGHLQFGAEEKARVRVDQQQRMAVGGVRGRDGHAVRPRRLAPDQAPLHRRHRQRAMFVKRLELGRRHTLDIAADAALGKGERHPRLEMSQNLGMNRGVIGQIRVQPRRPGPHQRLHARRAGAEELLQMRRIDEQPLAQILPQRAFALGLGQPAQIDQIIALDPRKIVLGLRIDHAVHRIGIGMPVNMRDAPFVARDGDAVGRHGRGQRRRAGRYGKHQGKTAAQQGHGHTPL